MNEEVKVEIQELPTVDVVTVVCPGLYALCELDIFPVEGAVFAVTEAGAVLPTCDYWLSKDGFCKTMAGIETDGVRICREKHLWTWGGGKWWNLDRLECLGLWSIQCALRIVVRFMRASRVVLIGHDCTVGVGCAGEPWPEGPLERMRAAALEDICTLTLDGQTELDHVRWTGSSIKVDHYREGCNVSQ